MRIIRIRRRGTSNLSSGKVDEKNQADLVMG